MGQRRFPGWGWVPDRDRRKAEQADYRLWSLIRPRKLTKKEMHKLLMARTAHAWIKAMEEAANRELPVCLKIARPFHHLDLVEIIERIEWSKN